MPAPCLGGFDGAWFASGQSARLSVGGKTLGFAGALHPDVVAAFELTSPVLVAEFDIEPLIQRSHRDFPVQSIPRMPR